MTLFGKLTYGDGPGPVVLPGAGSAYPDGFLAKPAMYVAVAPPGALPSHHLLVATYIYSARLALARKRICCFGNGKFADVTVPANIVSSPISLCSSRLIQGAGDGDPVGVGPLEDEKGGISPFA